MESINLRPQGGKNVKKKKYAGLEKKIEVPFISNFKWIAYQSGDEST